MKVCDDVCVCTIFHVSQAIQDITRDYSIPPEDIVTLLSVKIDVNGEGKYFLIDINRISCLKC